MSARFEPKNEGRVCGCWCERRVRGYAGAGVLVVGCEGAGACGWRVAGVRWQGVQGAGVGDRCGVQVQEIGVRGRTYW